MAKNYSDKIQNVSNKFFTGAAETENTHRTHDTQGTDNTQKFFRINLKLDADLETYLKDEAWKQRTSVTQYLNNLIREDMQRKQA